MTDFPGGDGGGELYRSEVAHFSQRAFARAIDFIVLSLIWVAFALPGASRDEAGELVAPSWGLPLVLSLWVVYESAMVAKFGATVGKMATLCRVVDRRSGGAVSIPQAVVRSAPLVAMIWLFGPYGLLVLVTAAGDRATRRGLLDWMAGTAVVRAAPPEKAPPSDFPPGDFGPEDFDNSDGRYN